MLSERCHLVREASRRVGGLPGLMGPGCTDHELGRRLEAQGVPEPAIERSGAVGCFSGTKAVVV